MLLRFGRVSRCWHLKFFRRSTALYIDALNYASNFFSMKKPYHRVNLAATKVRLFVDAAMASGFTVKTFIDATQATAEADMKWRTRRKKEVAKRIQNMPQSLEKTS